MGGKVEGRMNAQMASTIKPEILGEHPIQVIFCFSKTMPSKMGWSNTAAVPSNPGSF